MLDNSHHVIPPASAEPVPPEHLIELPVQDRVQPHLEHAAKYSIVPFQLHLARLPVAGEMPHSLAFSAEK